jgi:enediyne biosynthesis protein E4
MARGRRHWGLALALALIASAGLVWCAWTWRQSRVYGGTMAEIKAEMAAGRHAIAARNLTELIAHNPGSDEAAYLLGVCEQARGRNQAAAAAWARVTPGSSFSARAINAHMSLLIDGGQFAAAEKLINDAAQAPRNEPTALRILLLPLFVQQGRLEEAQQLVEQRWQHLYETGEEASELAINLARLHAELLWTRAPVEEVRASFDRAAKLAPDDDRIWLGRANLAMRTGNYPEAEQWLDACLKSRPDDVPVWRARLNWGMATSRIDVVRQALTQLPAREAAPAQIHRIAAWLAAKQGATATEREALKRLVASDPTDFPALDRLAELARQNLKPERAAEWTQRRAEISRLQARFRKLFDRNQPIRDAAEMGHLAETLGHPFEARVFLGVAVAESLNRHAAKRSLHALNQRLIPLAQTTGTLAAVVAAQPSEHAKADGNRGPAADGDQSKP